MDTTISTDFLIAVNILIGLAIAYLSFRTGIKQPNSSWHWVNILRGIIGILWTVVYIVVISNDQYKVTSFFGMIVVRPAITLTLGLLLANSILFWYAGRGNPDGKGKT
jgi:hypothetical protein